MRSTHYKPGKKRFQPYHALQAFPIPDKNIKYFKGGNDMNGILKCAIALLTALALVAVPCMTCFAQGLEQDDEVIAGKMAGDALVVRPLGICATVIGGALFIVSLPFSALGGNVEPAFNYLLADPFMFTFNRPLGEF
jgi:hypothetical protein